MNSEKEAEAQPLLKFPCSFPIKVMGRHEADFEARVVAMISGQVGAITPDNVRSRASSNGRFISVTVTVTAESREQLDNVYRALTASDDVLFVI